MTTSLQPPASLTVDIQRMSLYLLNLNHPKGEAAKAKFFLGWGFRLDDLDTFEAALKAHYDPALIQKVQRTKYDIRFEIRKPMLTPNGIAPRVCTAWAIDNGCVDGKLLTAHPY